MRTPGWRGRSRRTRSRRRRCRSRRRRLPPASAAAAPPPPPTAPSARRCPDVTHFATPRQRRRHAQILPPSCCLVLVRWAAGPTEFKQAAQCQCMHACPSTQYFGAASRRVSLVVRNTLRCLCSGGVPGSPGGRSPSGYLLPGDVGGPPWCETSPPSAQAGASLAHYYHGHQLRGSSGCILTG
jgi:hypothetical protein